MCIHMYVCAHTVRNTEINLLIEAKLLVTIGQYQAMFRINSSMGWKSIISLPV